MNEAQMTQHGRTAVVTGASSGIGAEIAREFSRSGASVVVVGRNVDRLQDLVQELESAGGRAEYVAVDVTTDKAPAQIVGRAVEAFGEIDVLVNAAGIFLPAPFQDTTDDVLDQQWNTNVRAPFRLTREALPHFGQGGSVIFVSSIWGHVGFPNSSVYCATKGAVELLVKSLTTELAPRGIRVNAVAPGNVRTNINAHLFEDADYERRMLAVTPAGRIGEVQDIAPAVVFLASPAAAYIHGVSLLVDGGWVSN